MLGQDRAPVELIVIDNASTDGTADLLDRYEAVATIIRERENTGFARGMNAGYAASRGDYVVLLNTDAALHPGFVREAVALFDRHPDVGVIAPEVLKIAPQGEWRFWRDPRLRAALRSEGGVVSLTPMMRVRVVEDGRAGQPSFKANGACPVVRRAAVEALRERFGVAPFDPVFDTYGEDVDFAFKAWSTRWRTVFAPAVLAGHVRSYASPLRLADKRGRLRVNLVAERYINAVRHLPPRRLWPVLALALAEDLALIASQRRRGDREAGRDVRAALARVWRMRRALVRFRRRHRTWMTIDFPTEVHCRPAAPPRRPRR